MGVAVTQSQAVDAQARLVLASQIMGAATSSAVVSLALTLATSVSAGCTQEANATTWMGVLDSRVQVHGINVNTATAVVILPLLRNVGTSAATGSVHGMGRLPIASPTDADSMQAVQAEATLPMVWATHGVAANTTRIFATLGPLGSALRVLPPITGYVADDNYYVALPVRPFYATLSARPFLVAMRKRARYVLSDPNMTAIFDSIDPREKHVLTLDASAELDAGETLTSINTITATARSGTPASTPTLTGEVINAVPLTLTVASKQVTIATGCGVQVVVSGGISGYSYTIAATCTTSNSKKVLTLKGILPVSER